MKILELCSMKAFRPAIIVLLLLLAGQVVSQIDSTLVGGIEGLIALDWKESDFQEIWNVLIVLVTMLWGQIAKLSKRIDDAADLPKIAIIGLGGLIIAFLVNRSGFNLVEVYENIKIVLIALGSYPVAKAVGNLLPFEIKMKEGKPTIKTAA